MKVPRGWKCKCGHKRTEHRYRYYGDGLMSAVSPCVTCGKYRKPLNIQGGFEEGYHCYYYKPQTNLDLLERKFARS